MKKHNLLWSEIDRAAHRILKDIENYVDDYVDDPPLKVFGVPRGGVSSALAVIGVSDISMHPLFPFEMTDNPDMAHIIIDDIIDSGATKNNFANMYPNKPFFALIDTSNPEKTGFRSEQVKGKWIVFPWEMGDESEGPEDNIRRLIEFIGDDPNREGLKDTPSRVVRSYKELFSGYMANPKLTTFNSPDSDEIILLKNIEFFSFCEHHMLPFFGTASIAYIPRDGTIIGISKLARILEVYTRRLQIQERIGHQVLDHLDGLVSPIASACIIHAKHQCMIARGVHKQNSIMSTTVLRGQFREDPKARNELFQLLGR